MLPLLAIVGVLVLLVWPRGQHSDGVHVVDTAGPIAAARQQAGFAVVTPHGLAATWRPTSADFEPPTTTSKATFRIGYVSSASKYAEFLESNDAADAVAAQYGPLTTDGTITVGSQIWQAFHRSDGRQLLRAEFGSVTVIVTGSASHDELVQLAGSMRSDDAKPGAG